ncbi:MAG: 3-hydroxyacyl-CoA dehydrogenase/enoyl-CoA hydratase family protein [Elusimicrobia bacterium]|nr:3-hydroxyacyl-CoA dehydrogenase/enoyl-CoA hydratase family protein [Elusimicrobiota bacterium]
MSKAASVEPKTVGRAGGAIRTVGVVGAGTMGAGIAQKLAMEGSRVLLVDQGAAYLDKARASIEAVLAEGQARRVLRPQEAKAALERMTFTTDLAELKSADLIIEAIYEDPEAKRSLFARLEAVAAPEAIFASNTSSLSVAELARSTRRPARFVGMHFFYHPVKNRLVEVIGIEGTDPAAYAAVLDFSRAAGKTPIEVKDRPGFAVNRFFVPWLNEAARMLEEGFADVPTIDAAAREAFGVGLGPFALMNATGVPIACHAAEGLARGLGAFYAPAARLKRQVDEKAPWALDGAPDRSRFAAVAERLWGVVFWVAVCLDAEAAATREDIDRGARIGLRWARGPFEEMNARGFASSADCVRAVCARHSLEFPEALASRGAQPWPLRYVDVLISNGVARIVLNRPETLNALDETLASQFFDAVRAAQKEPKVRGIVLESRGKAFMAGADVKFFARSIDAGDFDAILAFTRFGQELLRAIETSAKPVVALVDGAALGGGTELALACRARVVTPRAVFRLPETSLGIYPGLGGTQRLPRLIGKELAKFYVLTGAPLGAKEALALGLAQALAPAEEALARAKELARGEATAASRPALPRELVTVREAFSEGLLAGTLAGQAPVGCDPAAAKAIAGLPKRAPLALKFAEELIEGGLKGSLENGLELELSRIVEIFKTADAREGLNALLERRAPTFRGA